MKGAPAVAMDWAKLYPAAFFTVLFVGIGPVLGTVGCASTRELAVKIGRATHLIDEPGPNFPKEPPVDFREALSLLDKGNFSAALSNLDAFLADDATSPWTQSARYHRGRALEGLGEWTEAVTEYRRVAGATAETPKLQSLSLYRLSFCHEAIGDDQQTLADLHDLLSRTTGLPGEIRNAELPARLAGAYARVGNFEEAIEYYKKAEAGVVRLKHESGGGKKVPDWLPRTLYYMGTVAVRNIGWDEFESALRPLARSQVYLLEASELDLPPWSERASRELIGLYVSLWSVIESPPQEKLAKSIPEEREMQRVRWTRAEMLEENLNELRARAMTTEPANGSRFSKKVIASTAEIAQKIRALFAERLAGDGPTDESLARKAGIRGRVISTDDALEKKFLESARTELPAKHPKNKSGSQAEKKPADTQDPNL